MPFPDVAGDGETVNFPAGNGRRRFAAIAVPAAFARSGRGVSADCQLSSFFPVYSS